MRKTPQEDKVLMNLLNIIFMTSSPDNKQFRLRSYVRRDSRKTAAQKRALIEFWPRFGLDVAAGMLAAEQVFGRIAPCLLEIGFGSGQSLLAAARHYPDKNFIGVETHRPGIAALLLGIEASELTNLRIYHADVIDVLEQCIPAASLSGIQIFFPDPWPKRRHHPRRLIQADFVKLLVAKLQLGGSLHLATDWQDYAMHMLRVLSAEQSLSNLAGKQAFAARSVYRPIITKFERRAQREQRKVWELSFQRVL